jgi:hypothetical protein
MLDNAINVIKIINITVIAIKIKGLNFSFLLKYSNNLIKTLLILRYINKGTKFKL